MFTIKIEVTDDLGATKFSRTIQAPESDVLVPGSDTPQLAGVLAAAFQHSQEHPAGMSFTKDQAFRTVG